MSEALFASARTALRFALACQIDQASRSSQSGMNRLMNDFIEREQFAEAEPKRKLISNSLKGMSAQDKLVTAGYIRKAFDACQPFEIAVMVARLAPPVLPCNCGAPCCIGSRPNKEWHEAIDLSAQFVKQQLASAKKKKVRGLTDNPLLRRLIIISHFMRKGSQRQIAEECKISQMTVAAHIEAMRPILDGVERLAMEKIDGNLGDRQIIGSVT
jgi:hypothetical protein